MHRTYDIYFSSEKKYRNSKNGDSFNFSESVDEGIILLCVSDGVGSLSQDWLASETTCKVIIEKFAEHSGTIKSRLELAVLAAHSAVLTLSYQFRMAATLVAAVVDVHSNSVFYLSIGDSRIFVVDNESAKLITVDDTTSIPVKVNNSIIINDGLPLYTHPITKTIGQKEKLEFEIHSYTFNPGESVVLATDGIHNHGVLPNNIMDTFKQGNLPFRLRNAVSDCSRENNDDATILMLRRNDYPYNSKSLYEDTILKNKDFRTNKLYPHLLANCACELVEQYIKVKDWETVKKCLEYIYENKLVPIRNVLISWLDKIAIQNPNYPSIFTTLRTLIKISY